MAERDGKAVTYRLADGVHDADHGDSIDLGCCRLAFPEDAGPPG